MFTGRLRQNLQEANAKEWVYY